MISTGGEELEVSERTPADLAESWYSAGAVVLEVSVRAWSVLNRRH